MSEEVQALAELWNKPIRVCTAKNRMCGFSYLFKGCEKCAIHLLNKDCDMPVKKPYKYESNRSRPR